jgi:hypothetical protein
MSHVVIKYEYRRVTQRRKIGSGGKRGKVKLSNGRRKYY